MWVRCTYMPVRCSHYINISIRLRLRVEVLSTNDWVCNVEVCKKGSRGCRCKILQDDKGTPAQLELPKGPTNQAITASSTKPEARLRPMPTRQGDYWQYIAEGLSSNGLLPSRRDAEVLMKFFEVSSIFQTMGLNVLYWAGVGFTRGK